jgi:hypothetical protein
MVCHKHYELVACSYEAELIGVKAFDGKYS